MTLAILAAGRSSRFGRLKTLEPVGPAGEVLFEYAVCDAVRAGCSRVVFVTSAGTTEQIATRAVERLGRAVSVEVVLQSLDVSPAGAAAPEGREKPWGTGHAVLALRHVVDEPFLVANADDFYGAQGVESFARRVLEDLKQGSDGHWLAAYELGRTGVSRESGVNRGIPRVNRDGSAGRIDEVYDVRLTSSGRATGRSRSGAVVELSASSPCSMNLWAFRPSVFGWLDAAFRTFLQSLDAVGLPADPLQAEFLLSEAVGSLAARRKARLRLVLMNQGTAGLTHPADRAPVSSVLRRAVSAGDYPADLGEWFRRLPEAGRA